jgi:hypothetical protein
VGTLICHSKGWLRALKPEESQTIPMGAHEASQTTTARCWRLLGIFILVILATVMTTGLAHAETSPIERSTSIDLRTDDWLSVSSNRESLQSVEITGNLTAIQLPLGSHYPANGFNMTCHTQGRYSITLTFNFPTEYNVAIVADQRNATRREIASYYFSSGQLVLTIDLTQCPGTDRCRCSQHRME